MSRFNSFPTGLAVTISLGLAATVPATAQQESPVRVGVLYAQSGTMAASEKPLVDATLLAIKELNESCLSDPGGAGANAASLCGIRGRRVEPIVVDTGSDWSKAAEIAERMITQYGVTSIFGCWTSSCREAVVPVVERHRNLLWYPVQYEGLSHQAKSERPRHVMFTGAAPNQQILPAIAWANRRFGDPEGGKPTRFFLVGSNYVFPVRAHRLISAQIKRLGGEVVGQVESIELGSTDVKDVVEAIVAADPDVVVNTINGDSNAAFFPELIRRLRDNGKTKPILSFSVAEPEIREIGFYSARHQFAAWNYFQSVNTPLNPGFVERFRRFVKGENPSIEVDPVTSDPIVSAYWQVHLFARAASVAGSFDSNSILEAARGLILDTPAGEIRIDADNQHTWKRVLIGEVGNDGQFKILKASPEAVRPDPWFDANLEQFDVAQSGAKDDRVPQLVDVVGNTLPAPPPSGHALTTLLNFSASWMARYDASKSLGSEAELLELAQRWRQIEDIELRRHALARLCASALLPAVGDAAVVGSIADKDDALILLGSTGCARRLAATLKDGKPADQPMAARLDALVPSYLATHDVLLTRAALKLLEARPALLLNAAIRADLQSAIEASDPQFRPAVVGDLRDVIRSSLSLAPEGDADPENRPEIRFFQALVPLFNSTDGTSIDKQITGLVDTLRATNFDRWKELLKLAQRHYIVAAVVMAAILYGLLFLTLRLIVLPWRPDLIHKIDQFLSSSAPRLRNPENLTEFATTYTGLSLLLCVGFMARHRRVLDWWVNSRRDLVARQFDRFRADELAAVPEHSGPRLEDIHFDLPVETAGRRMEQRDLFAFLRAQCSSSERSIIQIVGEGGTGKTHLACQLAMHGYALAPRIFGDHVTLPVVINRHLSGGSIESADEFLTLVSGQLSAAVGGMDFPNLQFIRALLINKRLLVLMDDIVETAGPEWMIPSADDFAAHNVIATSRLEQKLGSGTSTVLRVRPVPLSLVTQFVERFMVAAGRDNQDLTDSYDQSERALELTRNLLQLFKSTGRSSQQSGIPAYFLKLCAVMNARAEDQDGAQLANLDDVFDFFNQYLSYLSRDIHSAPDRANCSRALKRLAWHAVRDNGWPVEVTEESARRELEALFPREEPSYLGQLMAMITERGLLHPGRPGHIKFGSDVFAEHIGVLGFVQDMAEAAKISSNSDALKAHEQLAMDALDRWKQSKSELGSLFARCVESGRFQSKVNIAFLRTLRSRLDRQQPIRVGILYSTSGPMAMSETRLIHITQMAIEEINRKGGIHGTPIRYVQLDGESKPERFAEEAQELIIKDEVISIFGCWTSASRKAVIPVVERHRNLLWYPIQYEGYEESQHVIYSGAAPNQQLLPALNFCLQEFGPRGLFVGSDYVFPRRANEIAQRRLMEIGAPPAEEIYFPLDASNFRPAIEAIDRVKPDFILNTINGESNAAFFSELFKAERKSEILPVMSLSMAETEVRKIGPALLKGHYLAWTYFHQPDLPSSRQFIDLVRSKLGSEVVTDDPMEAAYVQVRLFELACQRASALTAEGIREAALGLRYDDAPGGAVLVDKQNQHLWKRALIGRIDDNGLVSVVQRSETWIRPEPFIYADLDSVLSEAH